MNDQDRLRDDSNWPWRWDGATSPAWIGFEKAIRATPDGLQSPDRLEPRPPWAATDRLKRITADLDIRPEYLKP